MYLHAVDLSELASTCVDAAWRVEKGQSSVLQRKLPFFRCPTGLGLLKNPKSTSIKGGEKQSVQSLHTSIHRALLPLPVSGGV